MQAKFVACYEAISQAIWLKNFIVGLYIIDFVSRPITILRDNSTTIFFSKNNMYSSKSKHIELEYLVFHERV